MLESYLKNGGCLGCLGFFVCLFDQEFSENDCLIITDGLCMLLDSFIAIKDKEQNSLFNKQICSHESWCLGKFPT